ncbi:MAG: alpha/beta fold hydrolase [Lysobacterales bacterium]
MKRRHILAVGMASASAMTVGCSTLAPAMPELSGTGHRVRKGYLDGPFGQVHYYDCGQGPTLILAHQSPVCARQFEKALPLLAELGLRAIAIDTPGYGNSDVPATPPTIADYASIFPSVLAGLNLCSAHFLGHHTGGAILTHFAVAHPTMVKSLILDGPPLLNAEDLEPFKDIKHEPPRISGDGSHLGESWETRVKYTPGWTDKSAMHRRLVDQLWAGETVWYGHHAAFNYLMEPDFLALSVPTMIRTNSGDDIYYLAKKAHTLRPDFAYQELSGGTHDIVDEQPEAWSRQVAGFVHGAT